MLTKKQHAVLCYIQRYSAQHGFAPSYEEIAGFLGTTSRGSITKYIRALEQRGYLRRVKHAARSIEVIERDLPRSGIPLVGKIAAGQPLLAEENIEDLDLNRFLDPQAVCFLLEVKGDSMIEIGIDEGDYVLIEPNATPKHGNIVVALIDGYEATLKRFSRNKEGSITLTPENKRLKAQTYPANKVTIQGVLVSHIKRYKRS